MGASFVFDWTNQLNSVAPSLEHARSIQETLTCLFLGLQHQAF